LTRKKKNIWEWKKVYLSTTAYAAWMCATYAFHGIKFSLPMLIHSMQLFAFFFKRILMIEEKRTHKIKDQCKNENYSWPDTNWVICCDKVPKKHCITIKNLKGKDSIICWYLQCIEISAESSDLFIIILMRFLFQWILETFFLCFSDRKNEVYFHYIGLKTDRE
jgi:hypothetical protein